MLEDSFARKCWKEIEMLIQIENYSTERSERPAACRILTARSRIQDAVALGHVPVGIMRRSNCTR